LHTGGNSGSHVNARSTGLRALLPSELSLHSIAVHVSAPRLPRRGARDASFLVRKDAEPVTMSTRLSQGGILSPIIPTIMSGSVRSVIGALEIKDWQVTTGDTVTTRKGKKERA